MPSSATKLWRLLATVLLGAALLASAPATAQASTATTSGTGIVLAVDAGTDGGRTASGERRSTSFSGRRIGADTGADRAGQGSPFSRLFRWFRSLLGIGRPDPTPPTPGPSTTTTTEAPATTTTTEAPATTTTTEAPATTTTTTAPPEECTPAAYDATLPVELCGFPGVTPTQEANAEALVTRTIERLPQFATTAQATAAGYHSIGDAGTGYEHYINWSLIQDDRILDPDYPESLVYRAEGSTRTLEAAMFMLKEGQTLEDAPEEVGGPMVQWHIHDDLCFSDDPVAPRVVGITNSAGECRFGVKMQPVPMVHVWIVPHPCGPFSALEGISGGQPPEGEEHLCNDVHGGHGGGGHGH